MEQADNQYKVLRVVACVCNAKLPDAFLPAVMSKINAYVGIPSSWTILRACHAGFPRLMRLLLAGEVPPRTDPRQVAEVCNERLDSAAALGQLRLFQEFTRYFPTLVITTAADVAVLAGQAHIVSWLLDQDHVVWREQALLNAATHGSISGVKRLLRGLHWAPIPSMLYEATKRGNVALAQWLWLDFAARGCVSTLATAIANAPLPLAQWMASRTPSTLQICIDIAAARGDLQWIKWAHGHGAIATVKAMNSAAAGGHQDVLAWLHQNRNEGCSSSLIDKVAKHGRLYILKWLFTVRGLAWTDKAVFSAVINGHLECVQWLLESGPALCPPGAFDHAAGRGRLDIVEWMTVTGRGQASHRAMDWAATNGHIQVVTYLHTHRREGCTTAAMDGAAANGHMSVLWFLHAQRREGCTTAAFDVAALNNHVDVMEFLQALRGEGWTSRALCNAAAGGSVSTVQWLVEFCDIPLNMEVVDAAITSGNVELVHWLINECKCDGSKQAIDAAVAAGHFEVLLYMQHIRPIRCSAAAVSAAVATGNLYLASWAFHNCDEPVYLDANDYTFWRYGWTRHIVRNAFA